MSMINKILKNSFFPLLVKTSPLIASKVIYSKKMGKRLNLKNPKTINEKLMWLKLNEDDSLKTRCADKFLVRDYIKDVGKSHILIDLYQVYDSVEEIRFEELPNRFVMKCTHGSGFNIICSDKDKLDIEKTIFLLKKWMKTDYSFVACEPHYSKIKPRIIVEKFLEDELSGELPIDYMIHCFHGIPQVIEVGVDLGNNNKTYSTFNCEWGILPYYKDSLTTSEVIKKPRKLEEILEISRELSIAFTYVRVDLYYCHNKIYFGELTFTPGACLEMDFINDSEYKMGELLDLTVLTKESLSNESLPRKLRMKMVNLASKI